MKKTLYTLSNLILMILCIYVIHDMQSAQGVGYYFYLKTGVGSRMLFDILTDLVFCLMLGLLLLIPLLSGKNKTYESFSHFFLLFTAFIPFVRTDYVFSLVFNPAVYSEKTDLVKGIGNLLDSYRIILPFAILVLGYFRVVKGNELSAKKWIIPALGVFMMIPGALIPAVGPALLYAGVYLIIYFCHDCLEKTYFDSVVFYGFLFGASLYRLLSVSAAWSL